MRTDKRQPLLSGDILKKIGVQIRCHFDATKETTTMSAAMADAIKRIASQSAEKKK